MVADFAIRNGTIYDGAGRPGYSGDVVVENGVIVHVGGRGPAARRNYEADGQAVTPGFIDTHTHLDAQMFWDPFATSSIYHGVSTVIAGNCGLTLAPCKPEDRHSILRTFSRVEGIDPEILDAVVPWSWTDTAGYLAAIAEHRPALNFGMLAGHCALRVHVMGEAAVERAATNDEIAAMQDLLRQAMAAGAFGYSTNVNPRHLREDGKPVPSRLAEPLELYALGDVLTQLDTGVIQVSGATPGPGRITELAEFSYVTGRPVLWNSIVHRWSSPNLWLQQLEETEQAFRGGAQPWALTNVRPFTHRFTMRNTQTFDEFPTWRPLMFYPDDARKAAFADPALRARLRREAVEDPTPGTFSKRWDLVYILKPALPQNAHLKGKSIAELAAAQGKDVLDAFLDLALEENLDTWFETATTNGDPEAVGRIAASPYTVIGQSDAGAHLFQDAGFGYCTGLVGTFVRDWQALPMEEAVRKLTSMQAEIYGIEGRGMLAPGMRADILVFDPATVGPCDPEEAHDTPGGNARYIQRANGVNLLLVNGVPVLEAGALTEERPGQIIRSGGA